MGQLFKTLAFLCAICAFTGSASAALVDWSAQSWPAGSLSNSYDVDPANAGNDVTATISGDTGQLQPSLVSPNPQTPAITRAFDGGLGISPLTLELALNLTSNAQSVIFTLDFSALYAAGVSNVSFTIFDIDANNISGSTYQDVISGIHATSTTGTMIAPTITNVGPNVSLTGTGLTQVLTGQASTVDTGPGSDAANATISFNTTNISSITFTYGSGSMFVDPTYQHIGIYDIGYDVVPEPGTLGACILITTVAVWMSHGRPKRRVEKLVPKCPRRQYAD
jgi:hypothetical protein